MYNPNNLPTFIDIGFTGENLFREIQFDMSGWEGTPGIVYKRPDGVVYRPTVSFANHIMTWTIKKEDLVDGTGKLQIEAVSDKKRKSDVVEVRVNHGIMR